MGTERRASDIPEERDFVLSNLAPGPVQIRLALAIVISLLIMAVLIMGPLSGIKLGRIQAFVALYGTAMLVFDAITAVLLFAQFSIVRSRAVLVIANGYLFTALMVGAWMPSFPGVFSAEGLWGGLQTPAWLYVVWHCGFPLYVLGYALLKDTGSANLIRQGSTGPAIALSVAVTGAVTAVVVFICTTGEPLLPHIMLDRARYTSQWPYLVGAPIAVACIPALIALWIRRRSILDLWLMVVMHLWLIEIPLSYYPLPSRFSFGWYTVRVVALLSSSIILIVLLYEIRAMYARLLGAVLAERREREARLLTADAVAAAIAHEFRQPLTSMITSADAGSRFLDRPTPDLEKVRATLKQISADGHRAGEVIESVRATFRNDVRERAPVNLNDLVEEALALERDDLQKHQIQVQAEPNRFLPEVRGDRVQLQQVLLNLITNAIHAMATRDEPRILCVKSVLHEEDSVLVSVADTGAGIAPQDIQRIFNPRFTTKPDGMGMGLSICRSIIEAHDGRLWVVPNTPKGAVFNFSLHAKASPANAS